MRPRIDHRVNHHVSRQGNHRANRHLSPRDNHRVNHHVSHRDSRSIHHHLSHRDSHRVYHRLSPRDSRLIHHRLSHLDSRSIYHHVNLRLNQPRVQPTILPMLLARMNPAPILRSLQAVCRVVCRRHVLRQSHPLSSRRKLRQNQETLPHLLLRQLRPRQL